MRSEEIYEANAQQEVLEYLAESGDIDGAALGITRQVLSHGRDSLSAAQETVFERHVAGEFFRMECGLCGDRMPTNEVVYALSEGNRYCSHCQHVTSKPD
ncbi:hypothetical protein R5W24_003365 [Gemmata sp. JC717]|uniref:hypothetical protein n=1 Tax=Gemmata algarum TaxID=2975278 RepID=UPI0021BA449A|nr:hypothetical protein [Gemmata algarum]MDY3554246.1 hypothetical protein [Gemmata algarum]